jgi:glucose/arabinose dehydrogenase
MDRGAARGIRFRQPVRRGRVIAWSLATLAVITALAVGAFSLRRAPGFGAAEAAAAVRAAQAFKPTVAAPAADAPALVAGFADEPVANVPFPSSLAWTPDGRMLVTSTPGWLYVVQNDALVPTPALNITPKVCSNGEQGMVGVEVDPDFRTNHYIYIFYSFKKYEECARQSDRGAVSRVARFVLRDDNTVDPDSETLLMDNVPTFGIMHVAGDLAFGKDGYLYIATGDGACDWAGDSGCYGENDAARDQHTLIGKILRITKDGDIPPDNPWQGADSARCNLQGRTEPGKKCQETFAWGLRNPFRMAFDPNAGTTRFYINDVGENDWEEIDEGILGADYGWNLREGNCLVTSPGECDEPAPPGTTAPIFTYDHITACGAITGGAWVPRGVWPAPYDGAYLFADYRCGQVFRLAEAVDGTRSAEPLLFGAGLLSAVDLVFGPAGDGQALYYTTYLHDGQVRRVRHTGTENGLAVADPAFAAAWERTELPVLAPVADTAVRLWTWGPQPLANGLPEAWEQAAGGVHLVQYWDKGRMELGADGTVSAGKIVTEMVDGRVQVGDDTWEDRAPADEPLAGDARAPYIARDVATYRSLSAVAYPKVTIPASQNRGGVVETLLHADGRVTGDSGEHTELAEHDIHLTEYDETYGYNIPGVFADFLAQQGAVYDNGTYRMASVLDRERTVGAAISEPYWINTTVNGVPKTILIQAFERRILTYTPDNDLAQRVEMANVGQHYLRWRYGR